MCSGADHRAAGLVERAGAAAGDSVSVRTVLPPGDRCQGWLVGGSNPYAGCGNGCSRAFLIFILTIVPLRSYAPDALSYQVGPSAPRISDLLPSPVLGRVNLTATTHGRETP